jgi:hypothetical protein
LLVCRATHWPGWRMATRVTVEVSPRVLTMCSGYVMLTTATSHVAVIRGQYVEALMH